mgnify:CR=1 FL=1
MKIAVLDDYQGVAKTFADWRALEGAHDVHVFREHIAGGREAVVAALQDFDVIAAMRERTVFDRATLEQLPNLKFMVTTGMRNSSIDMAYLKERGIACSGTAGRTQTTPELAWGLILAVARNIPLEDGNMRAGRWQQTIGLDLEDKTLGIVGLGRLGREMARIGQAFKMDVIAWSQNLTQAGAAEVGVRRVEKGALFAEADVVTVHYKHSERSTGLLGAAEFAAGTLTDPEAAYGFRWILYHDSDGCRPVEAGSTLGPARVQRVFRYAGSCLYALRLSEGEGES